jgi:hypothetical protein
VEFYGLWAYCQEQGASLGTVCQRWTTAENELFNGQTPNFIRTSEGLITAGMIILSLGLVVAIIAAALPLLAFLAAALAFIAFILLVVGLPIFGRQSDDFLATRGDVSYNKRYGFWLMVPTIVLEFLAILAFLAAGILYKLFGFGNIATSSSNEIYGGRQMLGPPNMLNIPPPLPYGMRPQMPYPGGIVAMPVIAGPIPSLLSEYLTTRSPQYTRQSILRSTSLSVLPQPTIIRSISPGPTSTVTPAYVRISESIPPPPSPIINLSGQTLIGPLQRIS